MKKAGVKFSDANLALASFKGASLNPANFTGAKFYYTNASEAFCQPNPIRRCTKGFLEGRKAVVRE